LDLLDTQGLSSLFAHTYRFDDYTEEELFDILVKLMTSAGFTIESPKWARIAVRRLARRRGRQGFANARDIRRLYEQIITRHAKLKVENKVQISPV
jgi:hypothetical protein